MTSATDSDSIAARSDQSQGAPDRCVEAFSAQHPVHFQAGRSNVPPPPWLQTLLCGMSVGRALLPALLIDKPAQVVDELLLAVLVQLSVGVEDFGDEVLRTHTRGPILRHG